MPLFASLLSTLVLFDPLAAQPVSSLSVGLLRDRVSPVELAQLEGLVAEVETSGQARLIKKRRNFGDGVDGEAGHEVTYLHRHASPAILDTLWRLALEADASVPRWQIARRMPSRERPVLRCLEAISYHISGNITAPEDSAALGWHHDGASIFTVAVALTTAGVDYEGGAFETRDDNKQVESFVDMRRGDVAVWRGWDMHRVRPVTSGRRTVVVAEWWLEGPECSEEVLRPEDSREAIWAALDFQDLSIVLNEILADYHTKQEEHPEAVVAWRKVIELDLLHVRAHFNLGKLLALADDIEGAMRCQEEAIRIDIGYADSHGEMGGLYAIQGDLMRAEESLRTAIALEPRNADLHHDIGIIVGGTGDVQRAEKSFRTALSIAPIHGGAHFNMGLIQTSRGELPFAAKSFRSALSANPDDEDAQGQLSSVLARIGSGNEF